MAHRMIEYNGVKLMLLSQRDFPFGFPFECRHNWQLLLLLKRDHDAGNAIAALLAVTGKLLHGLTEEPLKVTSLCHVHRPTRDVIDWGFWTEPLTDLELTKARLEEIGKGGCS